MKTKNKIDNASFSIKYCVALCLLYTPVIPVICALPIIVARWLHFSLAQHIGLTAENTYIFVIFIELVSAIVIGFLIGKKVKSTHHSWHDLGLRRFAAWPTVKYIVAWPFVLVGCIVLVAIVMNLLGISPGENLTKSTLQHNGLLPTLVIASLFAPVLEEVLFRGMLFPSISRRYNITVGVMASSLIFAVLHVNPVQIVTALILGPYLCLMYRRLNSIYPGMILHALHNAAITYITLKAI